MTVITKAASKNNSIESLRGLAIILVVMGHVIGSESDGGMKVANDSFLRHLYFSFEYLRMPLFTVISGWVYSLRPVAEESILTFINKKFRRVILPMIFVGSTYYLIQNLTPGTNYNYELKSIWRIIIFPYTFFWYLYSLFLVYIIISIFDVNKWCQKMSQWAAILTASLLLLLVRDLFIPENIPNYFGFKGTIYLLPFFIIGLGINRFKTYLTNPKFIKPLTVLVLISLIFQQLTWYDIINYSFDSHSGLGLFIGVGGTIVGLQIKFSIKWLVWIGSYAYPIFLFHSFGTSGGRILLNASGITQTSIIFSVSLLLGLIMPILIVPTILDRFKLTRVIFLGKAINRR